MPGGARNARQRHRKGQRRTFRYEQDGLVEPERFGNIEGSVFNFETGESIPRALVTTSPATDAITVGDNGQFVINDVLTGAYTLTAVRNGFDPNTVTVQVRDGRTAQAALFLRPETDDDNPTAALEPYTPGGPNAL